MVTEQILVNFFISVRYIEALRQQLKDKVRRKKIELPPLCCCGDSIWDTNPETCANNCFFYKNPKGNYSLIAPQDLNLRYTVQRQTYIDWYCHLLMWLQG